MLGWPGRMSPPSVPSLCQLAELVGAVLSCSHLDLLSAEFSCSICKLPPAGCAGLSSWLGAASPWLREGSI